MIGNRHFLSLYNESLQDCKPLPKEEQLSLMRDWKENGNRASLDRLIKSNLRFVWSVAKRYQDMQGIDLADLLQVGNMGLLRAVKDFDPEYGVNFITYAAYRVQGEMRKFLMDNVGGNVKRYNTSASGRKLYYRLNKITDILYASEEDKDTLRDALSEESGVSVDKIKKMEGSYRSRDKPLSSSFEVESPSFDYNESLHESNMREAIEQSCSELNEREKLIIKGRFYNDEPLKLRELGEEFGLCRERVRQIESNAIKKLRDKMETLGYSATDFF